MLTHAQEQAAVPCPAPSFGPLNVELIEARANLYTKFALATHPRVIKVCA